VRLEAGRGGEAGIMYCTGKLGSGGGAGGVGGGWAGCLRWAGEGESGGRGGAGSKLPAKEDGGGRGGGGRQRGGASITAGAGNTSPAIASSIFPSLHSGCPGTIAVYLDTSRERSVGVCRAVHSVSLARSACMHRHIASRGRLGISSGGHGGREVVVVEMVRSGGQSGGSGDGGSGGGGSGDGTQWRQ